MGGTYSPPHIGHVHAAQNARAHLKLDKLILIPAGIPPHKELPEHTPSAEQRLEMTKIAARKIDACVSDIEIAREGKSYTADTIGQIKKIYPEDELFLIIGTDMFLTIQDWYQPERIFGAATLAVVAREEGDTARILKHEKTLSRLGVKVEIIPCEPIVISSSELRARIADSEIRSFLPDGVWDYIVQEHLYGV